MKIFKTKKELEKYMKTQNLNWFTEHKYCWSYKWVHNYGKDNEGKIQETYFQVKDKFFNEKVWIIRKGNEQNNWLTNQEEEQIREFLRNY